MQITSIDCARSLIFAKGKCVSFDRFARQRRLRHHSAVMSRSILLVSFLSAGTASAQVCPPDVIGCHGEDVDFQHRSALVDDVMLDSGWVPAGSPVQVRFAIFIGTSTEVDLGGASTTWWPGALDTTVTGRPGTGRLAINYGIEIIAMLRFDVEIGGASYDWEGDIPIGDIPRDLRLAGETMFDPFLFPPSTPVVVSDMTERVTVYELSLGSIIPIPGVDGGLRVDAAGSLEASYRTNRIEITDAMEDILTEGGTVRVFPAPDLLELGAAKDVVILPHGTIDYRGGVVVYPTLYIDFPTGDWEMTLADIPLQIVDLSSDTDFNTETVHVPLPDVRVDPPSLDYGMVAAGASAERLLTVFNDGELELDVTISEPAAPFTASRTVFSVPPRSSVRIAVTYAPTEPGLETAVMSLATNDPDEPLVTVRLTANVQGMIDPGDGDAGVGDGGPDPVTDGGCGCRAAPSRSGLGVLLMLVLPIFLRNFSAIRSRRRRSA
jgi:hypothetical protein